MVVTYKPRPPYCVEKGAYNVLREYTLTVMTSIPTSIIVHAPAQGVDLVEMKRIIDQVSGETEKIVDLFIRVHSWYGSHAIELATCTCRSIHAQ